MQSLLLLMGSGSSLHEAPESRSNSILILPHAHTRRQPIFFPHAFVASSDTPLLKTSQQSQNPNESQQTVTETKLCQFFLIFLDIWHFCGLVLSIRLFFPGSGARAADGGGGRGVPVRWPEAHPSLHRRWQVRLSGSFEFCCDSFKSQHFFFGLVWFSFQIQTIFENFPITPETAFTRNRLNWNYQTDGQPKVGFEDARRSQSLSRIFFFLRILLVFENTVFSVLSLQSGFQGVGPGAIQTIPSADLDVAGPHQTTAPVQTTWFIARSSR